MTGPNKAAAAAGVILVGAAVIEAALIPGLVIGAAAIVVSNYGEPIFRRAIRGGYRATQAARDAFHEAREQVGDIIAEVHAEGSTTEENS